MVFIFLVTPNILSIVATRFRKFFYGTQRNKISRMFDIIVERKHDRREVVC